MKLFSEIAGFLSIYFGMYVMVYGYNVTLNHKKKIDFKCLLIVGLVTLFNLLANYFASPTIRLMVSVLSVFIEYILIFKEKFVIVLFKTFIMFVLLNLCDMLVTSIYVIFDLNSSSELVMQNVTYFRILNTTLDGLLFWLLFLIKYFVKISNKLFNFITEKLSYVFLFVACLACISFWVLTYFSLFTLDIETLIISFLLISFFLVLCIIMIYQYFKNKNNEIEQQNLLDLMTDYEVMLDKDRINRHEMLNNLVTLKSYKNKASKDFEELLDSIIKTYEDKKSQVYSNLYKLPSGIKGIVYYRMANIKKLDINFNLLISKEVEDKFEKLNQKLYFKVCKVLGIILDNAVESTSETKNKILLIDIYLEKDNLVIYVENTFINNVDLSTIYNKGISSKGENRGYGLYLVKKIVNETNELKFEQSINKDRFITIIKIKNPS